MRVDTALALIVFVVSPVRLNTTYYVWERCPLKLSSVQPNRSGGHYSECVTVRVWMRAGDFSNNPKIEIVSSIRSIIRPIKRKSRKNKSKTQRDINMGEIRVKCDTQQMPHNNSFALWELVHDCVMASAQTVVLVSYNTTSTSCSKSYTVPDPVPKFNLSVDQRSKSITVTVEPGDKVHARLCYQQNTKHCSGGVNSTQIMIDPSQSPSALLHIHYLLPCVCVEVYYATPDAVRDNKGCPFRKESLIDVGDVWLSEEVTVYQSSVVWSSLCPASDLKLSASLCWKQHTHLCTPILNSTLEGMEDRRDLKYNTSAVDKHPQMCVQFSLQGSHHISCPFQSYISTWEVYIGPGRQSLFVYIISSIQAEFSAQLCVLHERGCAPNAHVHSVRMVREGNHTESQINVPLHFPTENLCVQVWQSNPALDGKRILCAEYTHRRFGMFAVVALIIVVIVALLGIFIHHLTKNGSAGWLCIQKPVLLVCSSEQSAHVSAACALASILQGELCATVRMALWAQNSQKEAGVRTGVADLGPLPWLYGQWESVCKVQGKVLIIWSPEAKISYKKWREERIKNTRNEKKKENYGKTEMRNEKMRVKLGEDGKIKGRRLGKSIEDNFAGEKNCDNLCYGKEWNNQNEPSSVIGPVFTAALACLDGVLQECKGHGVAFVYFQGLGHSRDIPKAFRGVPRYCLPQDFSDLIQELGGMRRETKDGQFKCHCWPRLLSKVLSLWLARQLAHRLRTLLPQTQGKKMQELKLTPSQKTISERKQNRLQLLLSGNMATPGTVQEQEPLHWLSWRGKEPESQVSSSDQDRLLFLKNDTLETRAGVSL
ncbi:hypothetical protein LDENG_00161770 [Lucifuga dentata]|nr:hypothetical protein LDENG_00161770 [Lucifuga dentata]